jgi:Domain of unknown function (DUF4214)
MYRNLLNRTFALSTLIVFLCCVPAYAQTDVWVSAEPTRVVPTQLSVFSCAGQTTVNARWVFSDSGYRVFQTPIISRSGQTITLDARVEEFTGVRTLALVPFEKNFDIGLLEPGTYTLNFKSWNTTLKQIQFTIVATPPFAQSIDSVCFFVTQHYRDFLSREADGSGFAFWTNNLANCGTDANCLEVGRINVSAAFLLSIEFKETSYYLYRMYKGALGRMPTYAEFVPETAELGKNVVVASNDPWIIRLGSNKDIYTLKFFNRPEFQARYGGLTNAQYVDKLFETEGVRPTPAERDEIVDSLDRCPFTIGCRSRVSVLRKITEHPAFEQKVFNEAFVTLQYFGYLRRDPDAAGFQFWLNKLNQFDGDFVDAEMVKAFITSAEYRKRFP